MPDTEFENDGVDALAESDAEDAALEAAHAAYVSGDAVVGPSTADGFRGVGLAEMQTQGNTLLVGDEKYHVSPLLFGRLAELHALGNQLPHILFAAIVAESTEPDAKPDTVDEVALLGIMRGISKDPGYAAADAHRDFRQLGARLSEPAVQNTIADIILMGVEEKHPDAISLDFLPYLTVPSCIAVIRAVWGGAVGDFFAPA